MPTHASRYDPVSKKPEVARSNPNGFTRDFSKSVIDIGNSSKKLKIKNSIGSPSDRELSKSPFKVVAKKSTCQPQRLGVSGDSAIFGEGACCELSSHSHMCPRIAVAGQVFEHSFDGSLVAIAISLQAALIK